jgi:carboxypeptidase D
VGNVHDLSATLYLDEYEYNDVLALGYPMVLVETQPSQNDKADAYTTPSQIETIFSGYAQLYPDLCRTLMLGKSVNGNNIWAIKITPDPDTPADKPSVKFIGTIHGDEPLGTELCMNFAAELLVGYGTDTYITDFLDRTVVWLVPMMNPDGFIMNMRYNAHGVDLNRAFPMYSVNFNTTWFDGEPLGDTTREPEIAHIMRWSAANHCALSMHYHGGALIVNYPYDNDPGIPTQTEAPSPDDAMFRYISLEYSIHNQPMYTDGSFPQGIVNGSLWYSITGGMIDWNYRFMGCPEVLVELSYTKKPSPSLIPLYWADNRDSMYAYAETAHIGIRGITRDRNTDAPVWSKVLLEGNTQPAFSNPDFGNYHKLVLAGTYNVAFHAEEYISYYVDNVVVNEGPATRVDIEMSDGDINGDSEINSSDIQLTVDAALGRSVVYNTDVNGRGITATDIQAVINKTQS